MICQALRLCTARAVTLAVAECAEGVVGAVSHLLIMSALDEDTQVTRRALASLACLARSHQSRFELTLQHFGLNLLAAVVAATHEAAAFNKFRGPIVTVARHVVECGLPAGQIMTMEKRPSGLEWAKAVLADERFAGAEHVGFPTGAAEAMFSTGRKMVGLA